MSSAHFRQGSYSSKQSSTAIPDDPDRSSKPDLVPDSAIDSAHNRLDAKTNIISPKIRSLLETLARPKERQLCDYYRDTLCIKSHSRPHRLVSDHNSDLTILNNVLTGAAKTHSTVGLIEAMMSGGGKITSWRLGGKIRSWSRLKFFLRIKAVARQIQDTLQLSTDSIIALCFTNVDLDYLTALFGCLMAGVSVVTIPTPENCSRGIALQFKSFDVKYIFTTPAIARQSSKKDEKERFTLWQGVKVLTPSKATPPQKWRIESSRISTGCILLFRHNDGQTTTVKVTQKSLSIQLSSMIEHWKLSSRERILSVESVSNEFLICGVFLPLYFGGDVFLLPPQLAKQSPEVWGRIVERHSITSIFCRAREFSWATQAAGEVELDLSNIRNVFLLDGRQPTCLNYATTASYTLHDRFKLNPTSVKGIVWSDTGGAIGTILTSAPTGDGLSPTSLLLKRDTVQSGVVELTEVPSPKCILLPGYMQLVNDLQLIVVKESASQIRPIDNDEMGTIYVRVEYFKSNALVNLQSASKHIFNCRIEGLPGTWVNTGLIGCQLNDAIVIIGTSDETFPVAPLDSEPSSRISVHPVTWDLLATILTDDREGMIFRQRVHVYSIPIASSNKLIVSAELSSKG